MTKLGRNFDQIRNKKMYQLSMLLKLPLPVKIKTDTSICDKTSHWILLYNAFFLPVTQVVDYFLWLKGENQTLRKLLVTGSGGRSSRNRNKCHMRQKSAPEPNVLISEAAVIRFISAADVRWLGVDEALSSGKVQGLETEGVTSKWKCKATNSVWIVSV